MHSLLPLSTFSIEDADYSAADLQAEYCRFIQRQTAIARCLDGQEYPDVVLDMLMEHGIEAAEYVEAVVENVEFAIANDLKVDDALEFTWND